MRDTDCGCRNGDRVQYGCSCEMMAGPDSQAATASGRTQQGCSSEAAKLPDLCRDRRTATADSRCRGRAVCSVTTGS